MLSSSITVENTTSLSLPIRLCCINDFPAFHPLDLNLTEKNISDDDPLVYIPSD